MNDEHSVQHRERGRSIQPLGCGKYQRAERSKIIKIFSKCPWPSGFLLWVAIRRAKQKSLNISGLQNASGNCLSRQRSKRAPEKRCWGFSGALGPHGSGTEGSWDVHE